MGLLSGLRLPVGSYGDGILSGTHEVVGPDLF